MKLHINWKKTAIATLDILLAGYLVLAMTSFNKPDETQKMCTKVSINITDENTNGFLSAPEIKRILEARKLYPLETRMQSINPRDIEDILKASPFVSTVECYKTQNGHVSINVTQRLPIVRIKSIKGEDYYVDDMGGVMASSKYTSDLIIATGYITKEYAQSYLAPLMEVLMDNNFWKNQIVQINVMPDMGIELVPRVGDHIIYMGYLPQAKTKEDRLRLISEYIDKKLERLEKFYRYGLSQAGWNRYHYISLEYDNQIICKKNANLFPLPEPEKPAPVDSTKVKKPDDEVVTAAPHDSSRQEKPKPAPAEEKKQEKKNENNKKQV